MTCPSSTGVPPARRYAPSSYPWPPHAGAVTSWGLPVARTAARREDAAADAARRFSPLAGWALLAVAASGIVNTAVRLPGLSDVFGSRYGLMVVAKAAALTLLAPVAAAPKSQSDEADGAAREPGTSAPSPTRLRQPEES